MDKRGYYNQYPRRRRGGLILFLIIIVGVLIYANSQGWIHIPLPNFGNLGNFSLGSQDNLIQTCTQKINSCSNVINSKFGSNVSILNSSQVQTASNANNFFSTWKSKVQSGDISSYNVTSYPIVMFATRFDNSDGTKSPYVFICKSDGNLEEKSSSGLC